MAIREPTAIRDLEPLTHALRHPSFLLSPRKDGAVAAALGPRGVAALSRIEAGAAGKLSR